MREGDRMCTTKMIEAISENRTRDLWFLTSSFDGVVGYGEITQLFLIDIITSTTVCHTMLTKLIV